MKLRELGCRRIEVGGVEDHVHCLCQFPPTLSISYLVQQVKGSSSHLIAHELPGLSGQDRFRWQGSYGAFTLSRADVPRVEGYVRNQKAHHRDRHLSEEWERTWLADEPLEK